MAIFVTRTSPPKRTQAPSPFRQNMLKQSHGGAGALPAADEACSARHSCLPAHLPSAHCQRERGSRPAPAITGSHCPIPSFLGWAVDTSLSLRGCFTPQDQPGSAWKVRGAGVSSHCSESPVENSARASPFVCLAISIFHCSRWNSSCDQQHPHPHTQNHWIQFNCLLLIMTILWLHYSFATNILTSFSWLCDNPHTGT